jgi:hypothetical protein
VRFEVEVKTVQYKPTLNSLDAGETQYQILFNLFRSFWNETCRWMDRWMLTSSIYVYFVHSVQRTFNNYSPHGAAQLKWDYNYMKRYVSTTNFPNKWNFLLQQISWSGNQFIRWNQVRNTYNCQQAWHKWRYKILASTCTNNSVVCTWHSWSMISCYHETHFKKFTNIGRKAALKPQERHYTSNSNITLQDLQPVT